jgi:hypothetical protein
MFYIHQTSCISHQPTYTEVDLENLRPSVHNQLPALEPKYTTIPMAQLRRMGRALRMGVGTGMTLLQSNKADGIIIGTANGGIEDSITFLNQIIDYDEGRLTPTNFVQSTFNAIAGLLGMITQNTGYNATHVHRGLAFENVVLDAAMRLKENPTHQYLIGGVDEISVRNYRMEAMAGWYKKEEVQNTALYESDTPGTLPGEGAAMFMVSNSAENAVAHLRALKLLHTDKPEVVAEQLAVFLKENGLQVSDIDVLLSGESGDNRFKRFYDTVSSALTEQTTIARYKHMFGEFQTSSALALWLACYLLQTQSLPNHCMAKQGKPVFKRILLYSNYQGVQHSFILVEGELG